MLGGWEARMPKANKIIYCKNPGFRPSAFAKATSRQVAGMTSRGKLRGIMPKKTISSGKTQPGNNRLGNINTKRKKCNRNI